MLKGYGFLTSIKLRVSLIMMIIISCVLLFILQTKKFVWLKSIASSTITAGVLVSTSSIIVKLIISKWAAIEILKTSILLKHGLIEVAIGIVILVAYFILRKITESQKEVNKDDISKEFDIRET